MKDAIEELGNLCKMATKLEREWDRAGTDFLGTRLTGDEYAETVGKYLEAVRRLEAALSTHFVVVTADARRARNTPDSGRDHDDPADPKL